MLAFALPVSRLVSTPVVSGNLRVLRRHLSLSIRKTTEKRYFNASSSSSGFSIPQRPVTMSSTAVEEKAGEETTAFQRLPSNVVPKHYNLRLVPNLDTFVFSGQQTVECQVTTETSQVLLNAADLEITSATWEGSNDVKQTAKVSVDNKAEVLTLEFEPALKPSTGSLKLVFSGVLNDKMKGFYRSKYRSPSGEEKYNAVTQFEATDARRCFPCWDEPAIKSTFDVALVVPKDKVSLSNMPVKKTIEHPENDKIIEYEYERTPIMSTYLLAFVVGEFDYVEDKTVDGVLCRVYTPPGKKEQGRFALDVTVKVLPYYKEYFGIAYPLPKMDLIAIADFSSGAMENWGLVTYRETCLLVDAAETSATNRQWVALVVGHELAHQWFGNLVTMEWWTHLWLNEGYASFVEFLCVDHLFPEYDIWTQFVNATLINALELDALESSHPIEVPVGHPNEIEEIFDDISYSKGAAIIRMLHDFIGIEDFKRGMNLYLTRHQYANAFTEDLWKALEDSSKKPVGEVMSTWTKQMGFPMITVTSEQKGTDRVLTLTQVVYYCVCIGPCDRKSFTACPWTPYFVAYWHAITEKFYANPASRGKSGTDSVWMIPLTFSTSSNPTAIAQKVLMDQKTMEVTIPGVDANQWVKINPGTVGYYRVRYTPEMLSQLIPAIREKTLPPLDRLGILDDMLALVQSGQSATVDVLRLLEAYVDEDNYSVWASVSNIMGQLNVLLGNTDSHDAFKSFGRRLYSRVEETVGWDAKENETHLDALLRSLVLHRMVSFDNQKTIQDAQTRFAAHTSGKSSIHADLRSAVYRAVLSAGDGEVYQSMLKLYRESDIMEEKDRIARALGAIKDVELLKQVLEFAVSEEVRSQDTIFVIISVGMSKEGRDLAWNFFKDRLDFFKERYIGGQLVSRLVKYVTENFAAEEKALEVEKFFQDHPYPGTERTVQQACESIRLNEAWLKRDYEQTKSFLASAESS